MYKKLTAIFLALVLTLSLAGCGKGEEDQKETETTQEEQQDEQQDEQEVADGGELIVSAAASLTESMEELEKLFLEKEGIQISTNLAGSGKLQKQIEEGAPSDVFISAGQSQMNALREQNLVDEDTVSDLLENILVIIQPSDTDKKISTVEDLKDMDGRIAIAETETV
ncbi:MAG: molybdate ABC transporter substrate-binding protein, partial [Tissierellia bacterium]|nr:molybdate ABC transporter substrate-binding protein [Tissierellia bacterium]